MGEGINETKQAVIGIMELACYLIKRFKDGVDIGDGLDILKQLISGSDLKKYVNDAVENINQVPAELKDLDAQEIVELSSLLIGYVPEIIEALKKSE